MTEMPELFHIGRKIRRLREIKGIKQEVLASKLGISHQAVSKMEQSETIDEEKLRQVADALEVTPETIKNFNEEMAINNISNTYENSHVTMVNYQFNPIEKIVELYDEKVALLERLLASEREKIQLLESITRTGK